MKMAITQTNWCRRDDPIWSPVLERLPLAAVGRVQDSPLQFLG